MIKDIMDKIKQNRFYINYSRMWPYVKLVWLRALCSTLICILISSLDTVITHRLSTIQNANNIVVINQGEIVEEGTHEQLLQIENGAYKALYEMQFKKQEVNA